MSPWIAITPSVISVVGLIIAGAMGYGKRGILAPIREGRTLWIP